MNADPSWVAKIVAAVAPLNEFANLSHLVSSAVGAAITLGLHSVWRWWRRPRIFIDADSGEPFVKRVTYDGHPRKRPKPTWIRIRVRNEGKTDALSVRAYLSDIWKEGDSSPLFYKDAVALWASSGGDGGSDSPLTISRGFERFFDVACFFGDGKGLRIPNTHYLDTKPYGVSGIYFITVKISGANFKPHGECIRIEFSDESSSVNVSRLRAQGQRDALAMRPTS
jgi:hypothetical protein